MNRIITLILLVIFSVTFLSSCEPDEEIIYIKPQEQVQSKISAPVFEKYLTTTTTSDCSIRLRFNNGGDEYLNTGCTVFWRRYTTKPTTTPKKSDMNKIETMRKCGSTKTTTTFDKTHTGYNGGNYIYYYTVCSNSKYSTETELTYCIVKR